MRTGVGRAEAMSHGDPDLVTASEIASWAWCPESWRLASFGAEPSNRADLARGEARHARKAVFEARSRAALLLGRRLLAAALVLLLLASFWFWRGK